MNLADKLIQLRKKNGWSQEELAEQMNVTRQSVSKWESGQAAPDLEKILKLSQLFGVSTDYLLKEELSESGNINTAREINVKKVSMKEAKDFLSVNRETSKSTAFAVFLCIISPICLMILAAVSENPLYGLSENWAAGIGMITLVALIAIAVAIFILNGSKTAAFKYLEKEMFETEYGVSEMVNEQRQQYKNKYTKSIITGVCICILSIIPIFIGVMINEDDDLFMVLMVSITLLIVGIGVFFLVLSSVVWSGFEKLLEQGDFSKEKKKNKTIMDNISGIWWLTATAVYLIYSFVTKNWGYSWIIWVAAGVLYPVVAAIINSIGQKS
ncbi:MAG: helix-turn-helix domain-containing protein [Lachnospiraceae bacterium]